MGGGGFILTRLKKGKERKRSARKGGGCFGKSMDARNIAVVHLKGGTRHQLNKLGEQGQFIRVRRGSAIGFCYDVTNAGPPLCAQGCRSIEIIIVMWPFISRPAPSSFILFPTQRSQRRRRGEEVTSLIVSSFFSSSFLNVEALFVQTVFIASDDQLCPRGGTLCLVRFLYLLPRLCLVLGLFLGR